MDSSVKLTREQLLETLYGVSYNIDGSVVKDTEKIRNYTIEVIEGKVHIKTFNVPVQILVEGEWKNVKDVVAEEDLSFLYDIFQEVHMNSEIILDTDDPTGISVRSRERVPKLPEQIYSVGIDLPREFAWVDGAKDISGVIILPQDDYDKVFIATDPDDDGYPEIVFIPPKTEEEQERPYYEKKDGKTYIYVNHFSGGGGTQSDPYLVENETDLNNVRNNLGAYYIQTRDIILSSFQTGQGWTPITGFNGFYDGRGYKIKDLFTNRAQTYVGLFGQQTGGVIRRVILENVNIVANGNQVGALCGRSEGSIEDCAVLSGTVKNEGASALYTGGLIGYKNSGSVVRSYNHADVYSNGNYLGGLVGYGNAATLDECFSTGSVKDTTIAQNLSSVGGLLGYNNGCTVTDCFYNLDKQNGVAKGAGTPLTTSDMKKQNTYANYDFINRWYMGDSRLNFGYPENRAFIKYKKGKGTPTDPYLLYNQFDLEQVRHFADACFRLESDIILDYPKTGEGWLPIGEGFNTSTSKWWGTQFSGVFDGNGKAIGNLYMRRRTYQYAGLFKNLVPGGIIKNLTIIDVDMEVGQFGGVIVGYMNPGSSGNVARIENCHVKKFENFNYKVYPGTNRLDACGGLVGCMGDFAEVENCSFNAPVQQQNGFYGGIAGYIRNSTKIKKCTVDGVFDQVSGAMGGIVGVMEYNTSDQLFEDLSVHADMRGAANSSGVIGYARVGTWYPSDYRKISRVILRRIVVSGYASLYALGNFYIESNYYNWSWASLMDSWTVDNCFYNRNIVPNNSIGAYSFVAKYTAEIRHPSIYTAYDMVNLWGLDGSYQDGDPYLRAHRPAKPPILGFRNSLGLYYTDEAGNILRYLEFGTLVAGSTSDAYPVWLQNNADFPVKDMKVWADDPTVQPGITVELSLSNNPFVPVQEIVFPGTVPIGEARQFYIRFSSDVTVTQGGTFDLKAKASPV